MSTILVLYHSRNGATANMARHIARGVEQCEHASAVVRTVPNLHTGITVSKAAVPMDGPPYATNQDLEDCDGLILGSPTHFGNMAAELKHFIDQTSESWIKGTLEGKPAGLFTSTGSMHGGQETTLISMMIPLLHHGMLLGGIPYSNAALNTTVTGGTPYGASHLASEHSNGSLSDEEKQLCMALGKRIATIATKLKS